MFYDMGFKSHEELLGKTDADIFDSSIADNFLYEEQKLMETGIPIIDVEHKRIRRNGEETWATKSKFPLYNSDGKSLGTFGITIDLTERKKVEQKLKTSEKRFKKIFEFIPSASFTVDKDKVVTSFNKKAEEITGYSADEIMGKECTIFSVDPCSEKCGLNSCSIPNIIYLGL